MCISTNIFGVFLDVCLSHLSLGLPYASRSLRFDPPLPLELIHIDITGPFPHMSMSQAKYALTFIDDFSRFYWVYFLNRDDFKEPYLFKSV